MPDLETHEFATKAVFGSPYKEVNRVLDCPSTLNGEHRIFWHDQMVYRVCRFHAFLDNHRDRLKLKTLVESEQLDEAERLVREIYSEMEQKTGETDIGERTGHDRTAKLKRNLQIFEEAVGYLKKLEISNSNVAVILSPDLRIGFPTGSPEAEVLIRELTDVAPGQKIAILKTDQPHRPIIIRKVH